MAPAMKTIGAVQYKTRHVQRRQDKRSNLCTKSTTTLQRELLQAAVPTSPYAHHATLDPMSHFCIPAHPPTFPLSHCWLQ